MLPSFYSFNIVNQFNLLGISSSEKKPETKATKKLGTLS